VPLRYRIRSPDTSLAMIPADLDFTAFVGDQTGQDFFSD
jgi:hypothetical protein